MAAALGYVDTLRILVDKGADINVKDSKRVSVWEYSCPHISIAVLGGSLTFSVRWPAVPFQMCLLGNHHQPQMFLYVFSSCPFNQAMHDL